MPTVDKLKADLEAGLGGQDLEGRRRLLPGGTARLYGWDRLGTFDYFTEAVVGEEGASRSDYTNQNDNVIVTGVAGDKGSLGYFGLRTTSRIATG